MALGLGPRLAGFDPRVSDNNGNFFDNRSENLRFLCPNCHSQTDTFGSKNIRHSGGTRHTRNAETVGLKGCEGSSPSCGTPINRRFPKREKVEKVTKSSKSRPSKAVWPSVDIMKRLLEQKPALVIAQELGVTSTALKKWCKRREVPTPPRGYWAKKQFGKL